MESNGRKFHYDDKACYSEAHKYIIVSKRQMMNNAANIALVCSNVFVMCWKVIGNGFILHVMWMMNEFTEFLTQMWTFFTDVASSQAIFDTKARISHFWHYLNSTLTN